MDLDATNGAQLEIVVKGVTEMAALRLIRARVSSCDVVIDFGAHAEHHAMVAARGAGNSGRVLAIDPLPRRATNPRRTRAEFPVCAA